MKYVVKIYTSNLKILWNRSRTNIECIINQITLCALNTIQKEMKLVFPSPFNLTKLILLLFDSP